MLDTNLLMTADPIIIFAATLGALERPWSGLGAVLEREIKPLQHPPCGLGACVRGCEARKVSTALERARGEVVSFRE